MVSRYYELRLVGDLPPGAILDFEGLTAVPEPATTVVYGVLDQEDLSGLLARLELLGVPVEEVRRLRVPPAPRSSSES
jgi:hypothetical protein